jgi:methanogenic corrinoid protein MtbC1
MPDHDHSHNTHKMQPQDRGANFVREVACATATEMLAQIRERHICIHEADIAVVLDAAKRSDATQIRIFERYEELLALTSKLIAAAEANERVVAKLGESMLSMQELVSKNTADIAADRAGRKAALVVVGLVSGAVGTLGSLLASFTVLHRFFRAVGVLALSPLLVGKCALECLRRSM